jgi:hypothetical protein
VIVLKFYTKQYKQHPTTKMPRKTDPEVKRLSKDMQDGRLDLTLTAKQLMDARPELRRYENQFNAFERYWQRMVESYAGAPTASHIDLDDDDGTPQRSERVRFTTAAPTAAPSPRRQASRGDPVQGDPEPNRQSLAPALTNSEMSIDLPHAILCWSLNNQKTFVQVVVQPTLGMKDGDLDAMILAGGLCCRIKCKENAMFFKPRQLTNIFSGLFHKDHPKMKAWYDFCSTNPIRTRVCDIKLPQRVQEDFYNGWGYQGKMIIRGENGELFYNLEFKASHCVNYGEEAENHVVHYSAATAK